MTPQKSKDTGILKSMSLAVGLLATCFVALIGSLVGLRPETVLIRTGIAFTLSILLFRFIALGVSLILEEGD